MTDDRAAPLPLGYMQSLPIMYKVERTKAGNGLERVSLVELDNNELVKAEAESILGEQQPPLRLHRKEVGEKIWTDGSVLDHCYSSGTTEES